MTYLSDMVNECVFEGQTLRVNDFGVHDFLNIIFQLFHNALWHVQKRAQMFPVWNV